MPSRATKDCEICNGSCKGEYKTGDVHPSDLPARKWPHKFELIEETDKSADVVGARRAVPETGENISSDSEPEGGEPE